MEKDYIDKKLADVRNRLLSEADLDDRKARRIITEIIFDDEKAAMMTKHELTEIIEKIFLKTRRRMGILSPLIEDENITEIMVNGPDNIFIEKMVALMNII